MGFFDFTLHYQQLFVSVGVVGKSLLGAMCKLSQLKNLDFVHELCFRFCLLSSKLESVGHSL